ncbi:hypothetical protein FC75_GL001053 [Lacticaseibacillus camelliae DSM 22697 = JCM 13995]|uniref:Uncharacterized protein n=1 Tax=Lacticaseibacillus camelliae DSM 22697 = JCM 13995 TaxID=1423730 RepID=A0A0R2F9W4_9LACO|nr:hypothetical protein FC75_GL001053 [Lacticaseibacillus camelliae DSM 22697 = JCM 13995]
MHFLPETARRFAIIDFYQNPQTVYHETKLFSKKAVAGPGFSPNVARQDRFQKIT